MTAIGDLRRDLLAPVGDPALPQGGAVTQLRQEVVDLRQELLAPVGDPALPDGGAVTQLSARVVTMENAMRVAGNHLSLAGRGRGRRRA